MCIFAEVYLGNRRHMNKTILAVVEFVFITLLDAIAAGHA